MFRKERYFDKNDRPQNMWGNKIEVEEELRDDEEITLVTTVDEAQTKSESQSP